MARCPPTSRTYGRSSKSSACVSTCRSTGCGCALIAGNELFSNANSYLLSDDSSYPYYLWLPSWLGRFYIDADRIPEGRRADDVRTADARHIAFVWPWLGFNDAYVKDAGEPECWFGVA